MNSFCERQTISGRVADAVYKGTHDCIDVVKAVRVEEELDVLAQEPLVCCQEVQDVRQGVFGLYSVASQPSSLAEQLKARSPCRSGSSRDRPQSAT